MPNKKTHFSTGRNADMQSCSPTDFQGPLKAPEVPTQEPFAVGCRATFADLWHQGHDGFRQGDDGTTHGLNTKNYVQDGPPQDSYVEI